MGTSDVNIELWDLCWEVNAEFATKLTTPARCLKCSKTIPKAKWSSTFISTAVEPLSCGHTPEGFLCGACDADMVVRITKAEQGCFEKTCENDSENDERLVVNEEVVRERLSHDGELTERYFKALHDHTIVCNTCCETKPHIQRPLSETCQHEARTCEYCVRTLIDLAVKATELKSIKCPDIDCMEPLSDEAVREFATPGSFKKYSRQMFLRRVGELEDFRYCLAPGCSWGQSHPQKDIFPKICCTKCGAESCFTCQVKWHRGLSCAESQRGDTPDKPSREYLEKFCKRCPSCGAYIEKNGLCPDMTCVCGKHFCWECKVLQGPRGYRHLRTCRYSPGSLSAPNLASGTYRVGWNEDPGYQGHPGEYAGGYERLNRVGVEDIDPNLSFLD